MNKLFLVPLLALAACTSSGFDQPKASSFTAGSCRDLAPGVLGLGKTLHGLGKDVPSDDERSALTRDQKKVRDLQPGLDTALAPMVRDLVTAIGILRIRTDTNSYDVSLVGTARSAYERLVTTCTTKAP